MFWGNWCVDWFLVRLFDRISIMCKNAVHKFEHQWWFYRAELDT